jgi:hypothetical protein
MLKPASTCAFFFLSTPFFFFLYIILCTYFLTTPSSRPSPINAIDPPPLRNAKHLFNALTSSLRQWGGSLNHNGMSFFLATVPQGVRLYHGQSGTEEVRGMEWLAFEAEHAMVFGVNISFAEARADGDDLVGESEREVRGREAVDRLRAGWILERGGLRRTPLLTEGGQRPLLETDDGDRLDHAEDNDKRPPPRRRDLKITPSHLHTYTTLRPLNLLYLDGQSAAKTLNGTLDSQDYILLLRNATSRNDDEWYMWDDFRRAQLLCQIAATEWGGKIDGFLRMEPGFEVILCEFEGNVELEGVEKASWWVISQNGSIDVVRENNFAYYRAVTERYDGLGGDKAKLRWKDEFVSAYACDGELFGKGGRHPRLVDVPFENRVEVRRAVTEMVLAAAFDDHEGEGVEIDWQAMADKTVSRYSSRLRNLVSGSFSSAEELRAEIERTMQPFVDFDARNASKEVERCARQFIPSTASPLSLPYRVVLNISHTICSTLSAASQTLLTEERATGKSEGNYENVTKRIKNLVDYLDWPIFKKCQPSCGNEKLCLVPIWPAGRMEDFERPSCGGPNELMERIGYWGERGWEWY